MKLIEFLETLDPQQPIKIGAKDGSNYFYVGTSSDMLLQFDKGKKCYGEYDRIIEKCADRQIEKNERKISDIYEQQIEHIKKGAYLLDVMRNMFQSQIAVELLRLEGRQKELIANRKKLKPLEKRNVIDHFHADKIVDDTLVIIVEGTEYGSLWIKEEANKGFGGNIKPTLKLSNMGEKEK